MKRLICLAFCAALLTAFSAGLADTLTVDANEVLHAVSPTLYGIFIEDINCAVDGGLYPELVKNRSFENENLWNPQHADHWEGWSVRKWENAKVTLENENGIHPNNPTYLHAALEADGYARILNQGFGGNLLRGGIPLETGESYDFSCWLRADAASEAEIRVSLTDQAGSDLCGMPLTVPLTSEKYGGEWFCIGTTFTAEETAGAVLLVEITGKGAVDLDMVSLMPQSRLGADWPGGGVRADLVEALRELHPKFMRFPGGCVAEGTYDRANAYEWKNTVGDLTARREIPNTWGGSQTMGVGFYEYFCLAEEIGALPVPVVHAGLLCQCRDVKDPPLTMKETAAYAQDILDLIEFATGSADTEWGKLRAGMGHPEPFDLRYIAIGNENWGAAYFSRYDVLRKAVKEKYPDITCIVAAGPWADGNAFRESWNSIRRRFPDDLVDEHYYMESAWFPQHVNRYDKYPRTTKVFLGEFAAHEPVQGSRRPNNLYAALCEAAYLTGVERNSDVVVMSCYAPLLAREGEVDWTPDLIWFNDAEVYLTPSYYVQQIFSMACGEQLVKSETDGSLFQSATRTESELQIKVVNLSDDAVPLRLLLPGVKNQEAKGEMLTGGKNHVNSFVKPDKVSPREITCGVENEQADMELPAWSLTILKISLK